MLRLSRNIYFTGFMGAGKSRVGEATAKSLGWRFVDTDRFIEEREGRTIPEIFAQQGEAEFRRMEREAIDELSKLSYHVIALGGGALTQPSVAETVKRTGVLVRLNASVDVLSERIGRKDNRPLMAGLDDEQRKAKIRKMLAEREKFYALADFAVESSEELSVDDLVAKIREYAAPWEHKRLEVETPSARYPILIGDNFLSSTGAFLESVGLGRNDTFVVTDENIARAQAHNLRRLAASIPNSKLYKFVPGEQRKNLESLNGLWTRLLSEGCTRKTTLVQFSGGVVGDMAGFCAATYQRGIPFVQVPTTLLAMVDSSVGGKVAINHPLGKNMIGAFYQPKAVLINLEVLHTLPPQEYLAGLAEVVKYGVIRDEEFFSFLESNAKEILNRSDALLARIVERCCAIKAEVVGKDEKEQGLRAILNYGHTFGHAIEKLTDYKTFSHGIAVALGMRVAGRMATETGLWSADDEKRQTALLDAFGFPDRFRVDVDAAWAAMGVDKKAENGRRVFVLPERIGAVRKVVAPDRAAVDSAWAVLGGR